VEGSADGDGRDGVEGSSEGLDPLAARTPWLRF
jgi:hypothetical protein